eukprot:c20485_g1_i1.p1 GENE.c20485_g1_i1~~c20485_g1_i1.p1  ORF type:complete len:569 (-),score=108.00 c20485_g1_i1:413-2119(-)
MNPFKKLSGKSKPKDPVPAPAPAPAPAAKAPAPAQEEPKKVKQIAKEKNMHKSSYHITHHKTSLPQTGGGSPPAIVATIPHTNTLDEWNSKLPDLEGIPTFKDVPAGDRVSLFLRKLRACQRMFVWHDGVEPQDDPQWEVKELKRKQLVELVDFINQNSKLVFVEDYFDDIVAFASVNMFRGFLANPTPPHIVYDPEEDEPLLEPSWPHLQFVMEFFLRFVVSADVDPKIARKYIDQTFITRLLALFDSEDVRERDFLKTILHRIYGKFMQHRAFIRKSINDVFYHFVYNTERYNGIAELLEILGSIINGFALPLKDEHKFFLRHGLMPLHKVKYVSTYHNQLSYCITQFCEKDHTLAEEIILGIMRYWPQTNSPKEVLYLQELEEVLELTQPPQFQAVLRPLFYRLNRCIMSQHFQVAERALFFWHNEYIVSYIAQHHAAILPSVFPALMHNTKGHWNTTVYQLTINVVKMFNEMDPQMFEECAQQYKKDAERDNETRNKRDELWHSIETVALTSPPAGWVPPTVKQPSILQVQPFDIHPDELTEVHVDQQALAKKLAKGRHGTEAF